MSQGRSVLHPGIASIPKRTRTQVKLKQTQDGTGFMCRDSLERSKHFLRCSFPHEQEPAPRLSNLGSHLAGWGLGYTCWWG